MSTIEIKREYGQSDRIEFSFRYILLTESQKNEIEKEFEKAKAIVKSNLSKDNGYVVMLDLAPTINPSTVEQLNKRLNIDETKFGIWVSLTTYFDHSGLSFPDYVLDFIRIVGGQVSVSKIMISEDE